MRLIVACPACRRRYDASKHPPGSRYRCSCGGVLSVPEPRPHDAAVVRCSACGAPRSGPERSCRYCGSDFTLHERDLDTLCPECMARVSSKARFCHACATPLLLSQAERAATEHPCPACGPGTRLASRRLGGENVAILECQSCAGLWVEKEIFEVMAGRARSGKLPDLPVAVHPKAPDSDTDAADGAGAGSRPLYRPCAVCGALMNRRNYGRRSGVILDVCRAHGIWFDVHELDRLLAWIREGGEDRAEALRAEEQRRTERQKQLFPAWPSEEEEDRATWRVDSLLLDLLGGVVGRFLPRLFN
jgi:Zn-finger nucleic acid-binding protein